MMYLFEYWSILAAFSGMGMKVHSESYLSELFSMRNYPEESNVGSWSLPYEDRFPKNGRCYNGLTQMPSVGNADFGTEILRQTMLRQEHIFRKQVFELHRLYRVQRNLMNEIQKDEVYKHPFQSLVVSSHMPSFASQLKFQPTFPIASSPSGPSMPSYVNGQTLNFAHEESNFKGSNIKEIFSNKIVRLPKRPFDLQLPAEEYMDAEDGAEISEDVSPVLNLKQTNVIGVSSSNLEIETKFTLGAENEQKSGLLLQPRVQFVADLNIPVQESVSTEVDDLASDRSWGPTPPDRKTEDEQLSVSLGLSKDIFQGSNMYTDQKKFLKLAHLSPGKRVEWPSHCAKPEDENNNSSSSISSWKKLDNSSTSSRLTVQAHPCFNNLSSGNVLKEITDRSETWNFSGSARSVSCFESDASSLYGFCHSAGLELGGSRTELLFSAFGEKNVDSSCNAPSEKTKDPLPIKFLKGTGCADVSPSKEMNLNLPLSNGLCNGISLNKIPAFVDGNATVRSLPNGPTWLRKKVHNPPSERGACSVKDSLLLPANFASNNCHVDILRTQISDGLCPKKSIDNHNDNFSQTTLLSELSKQKVNVGVHEKSFDTKLQHELAWLESNDQLLEDDFQFVRSTKGIGLDLNLSASAATCTEGDQFEVSSKTPTEISEENIVKASVKTKTPIDLEAPAPEDMDMGEEEHMVADKSITPCEHSNVRDIETTLVQSAAEGIVAMSTSIHMKVNEKNCSESIYHKSGESSSSFPSLLSWFADFVANQASDNERGTNQEKLNVGVDLEPLAEDSDYFEEMTLRLIEVDVSEYCNKSWEKENSTEVGVTSSLTRLRKGNSRRGRQRRDFQKDILPGMASLSWHEVTEDLQTIGGLMRASDSCWQVGIARRNTRNGWYGSTTGRRRRGSRAANTPQQLQHVVSEVELEGMCLHGWGKTTRRARRQRCPTVNITSLLT